MKMDPDEKQHWLFQDLWSEHELCYFCSGIDAVNGPGYPGDLEKWEQTLESIKRANLSGLLKAFTRTPEKSGKEELYYVPRTVIDWATAKYPSFPFTKEDFPSDQIGKRQTVTHMLMLGALSAYLAKKNSAFTQAGHPNFSAIAKAIANDDVHGLSETNLRNTLAEAFSLYQDKLS